MPSPSLTTVLVTQQATLLFGAQGSTSSPITVINTDGTNTIWIGNQSNIMPGVGAMPLLPGSAISFDGSVSVYAVAQPGIMVIAAITPGGASYSPGTIVISGPVTATISGPIAVSSIAAPVSIASIAGSVAIASVAGNVDITPTSGYVPSGLQAAITSITAGTTIASGATATSPVESVAAYNSFNLGIACSTANQATAGAAISAQVQLNWYADAAGTLLLQQETFWIWCTGAGAALPALISGPMAGPYMTITVTNPGNQVMTVSSSNLFGNPQTIASVRAYQNAPASSQLALPTSPHYVASGATSGTDGILTSLIDETAMVASTIYWLPCPLQIGPVDVSVQFNGAAGAGMTIMPTLCYLKGLTNGNVSVLAGNLGQIVWAPPGNTLATQYAAQNLFQPRCPLFWVIEPGTTAPTSINVTMLCSPT